MILYILDIQPLNLRHFGFSIIFCFSNCAHAGKEGRGLVTFYVDGHGKKNIHTVYTVPYTRYHLISKGSKTVVTQFNSLDELFCKDEIDT